MTSGDYIGSAALGLLLIAVGISLQFRPTRLLWFKILVQSRSEDATTPSKAFIWETRTGGVALILGGLVVATAPFIYD